MALSDTMDQMNHLLGEMAKDLSKARRGNKTAAQRVRTYSIRFQKIAKSFRKESLQTQKGGRSKKKGGGKRVKRKRAGR